MKNRGGWHAKVHTGGLLLVAAGMACAQAPTTPPIDVRQQGEQQERLQREREEAQRGILQTASGAPEQPAPQALTPWPENEVPCLPIREISLTGDTSVAFQWALHDLTDGPDPAVGRCLGVDGVNVAARRAERALIERGYITSRIVFREQSLADGRLSLALLPGRIGTIRFAQPDPRANAWNAVPARPGDILNLRDVEQGLENLKRVPSAEADIQIIPAEAPDQSDLVIVWRQALPFRFNVSLDDSGSRSTGKYQGSTTLSYDHWWTLNDLFYVTLNQDLGGGHAGDRGTQGHTIHYSVPWDHWLLGFTQSNSRYRQSVPGFSQDYLYSGRSETAEIRLSRVLHRTARHKTSASLKGWLRRSRNFIDDTEVETQRHATGGWELGVAHKAFLGSASLDVSLTHKRGTAAFGAQPTTEEAFNEGTSRMRISTLDIHLNAPFALAGQKLRYGSALRAQRNGTQLIPQDRFAIGGRYTVRGFDGESSLSAERGWFMRNDLGWTLGDVEAYLGLDHGAVNGPTTQLLVGRHLTGAVIGVRGNARRLNYDLFIGKPLGKPTQFRTHGAVAGFSLAASF